MSKQTNINVSGQDFDFEDMFNSSCSFENKISPRRASANDMGPDEASSSLSNSINGVVECTEEDIGDEQEYDDIEDPEETNKEAQKASLPPKESIAMSATINLNSFTVLTLVGKGGFGKVHQVLKKDSNEVFAMKSLKKRYLIKTKSVIGTIAEKDILRKVRHPFIVRLHYAFQSDDQVHLIMDFVNGGHLLHHLSREAMFSESQARFYIAEVVLALQHLHSLDIIHRDLKPENVLLDAQGHCILTDFGFAKENVNDLNCNSFCGTLEYMAPEVIKKSKYGKPADWWSVGILLCDMLMGHPPFEHKNDRALQQKILNDKLRLPTYLTPECRGLINGLLQRDIKKRFGFEEIRSHKFFKTIDWDLLLSKQISSPILPVTSKGIYDVSNFDKEFVNAGLSLSAESPSASPLSSSQQLQFKGFTYVKSPAFPLMML